MAPILVLDPNLAVCPDFTTEAHATSRLALTNLNLTEEQAVDFLKTAWQNENNAAKIVWGQQLAERQEAEEEEARVARENAEAKAAAEREELEAVAVELKKKYKAKFLPIENDTPMPDHLPVNYPHAVMQKLQKGEYVEMWFFTERGIRDTSSSLGASQPQTFSMTSADEDGVIHMMPTAAAKVAKLVQRDEDLSWEDFTGSYLRFLAAMRQTGWPEDRVKMFGTFWSSIMVDERATSVDDTVVDKRTLIIYQAEQRRAWHDMVALGKSVPNLAIRNASAMDRAHRKAVNWRHKILLQESALQIQVCNNLSRPWR
ncbi:hypothetical protein CVT24_010142 [Panaeolus cyanescens]|uniref:Uncharacterized protein n=1 Tax=Panaeolus cyanescens TaxID=181874 RepID=A0A409X6P9_9AGAR|nr:hypothetical protein CVT24_010142 [Panaeolus cyanescens]